MVIISLASYCVVVIDTTLFLSSFAFPGAETYFSDREIFAEFLLWVRMLMILIITMGTTYVVGSGVIRLDLRTRKFFIHNYEIFLRSREFDLLYYFIVNRGSVVSRTQILEEVWDRNIVCSTNTVDVHVSLLRRKFRTYLSVPLIRTVHAVGYVFDL